MTRRLPQSQAPADDLTQADWNTSRYSGGSGGTCAEVAFTETGVALRNSRDPNGPVVEFLPDEWVALYLGMLDDDPNVAPPAAWVKAFSDKSS